MATKLDTARPLYMGPNPARESTVVDNIRRAVMQLDKGQGVSYQALEDYLLQNYAPSKSKNYNGSFVKSYVRDAVNKYGYLSHDNGNYTYSTEAGPAPRAPKAKRVTKAKQEVLDILKFIRDAGEVADAGDVDNTNITPEDVAQELGKRKPWVDSRLEAASKDGLARVEDENGRKLVYLTAAGYAEVNASDPEGAASGPGADVGHEEPEQD